MTESTSPRGDGIAHFTMGEFLHQGHVILAWALLLRDYVGSPGISFKLHKCHLCQGRPPNDTTISLTLMKMTMVEEVLSQIDEQISNDVKMQATTHLPPLSSRLCICFASHDLLGNHEREPSGKPAETRVCNDDGPVELCDVNILCNMSNSKLSIRVICAPSYARFRSMEAPRIRQQLRYVFDQLGQPPASCIDSILRDVQTVSETDMRDIWRWNLKLPEPKLKSAAHVFSENSKTSPAALAVHAWDGDLTYGYADHVSDLLALSLIQAGVGRGHFVPLCFEKSKWAVVAILAVIKAGAAFVLLDEDLPQARLDQLSAIISGEAPVILASPSQKHRAELLASARAIIVVDHQLFGGERTPVAAFNPQSVLHSDIAYAVFTSGTTGTPKAALIRHSNICSFAALVREPSGVSSASRILALASYAYDVSLGNIFLALLSGCCLCIPSSWECKNAVPRLIQKYRITHVQTTPSVSRILLPSESQTLEVLDLCGELCSEDVLARWIDTSVRVMNTYSPAECTVTSVLNPDILASPRPSIIGAGLGACWVVDPEDDQRLTPIGGIGELLLEGPLVGAGYLHRADLTKASFVQDPAWLLRGLPGLLSGRTGTLYRTGDLVRYTDEGNIEILGRRDSQIKIRGQRVELGEISYHLHKLFPPPTQPCPQAVKLDSGAELLVVFLVQPSDSLSADPEALRSTINAVDLQLNMSLPRAWVPSAYLCVDAIPLTLTGKTDHAKLKLLSASIPADQWIFPQRGDSLGFQLVVHDSETPFRSCVDVHNDTWKFDMLRSAWSEALHIDDVTIDQSDTFFDLGGESLSAIKLVGVAAQRGLRLDFATIFRHPRLSDMVMKCRYSPAGDARPLEPFSLLSCMSVLSDLAAQCDTAVSNIVDVYPCTPLQEGLMASETSGTGTSYRGRQVLQLPVHVDGERLKRAWECVAAAHPILRTRIVDSTSDGLVQAVLADVDLSVAGQHNNLSAYLDQDEATAMGFGDQLCRWAVVRQTGSTYFVLTMHHAIYDGWTLPRLGGETIRAYFGEVPQPSVDSNVFIQYIKNVPTKAAEEYWASRFASPAEISVFPGLKAHVSRPRADSSYSKAYSIPSNSTTTTSMPSLLTAAWALLAGKMMGTRDVVFGSTVSGRDVPVAGIEDLLSPTISTIPVRIAIDQRITVRNFIQKVQDQALEAMPFEHLGLQAIRKINSDTRRGSQFQTLFIVHPPSSPQDVDLQACRDMVPDDLDVMDMLANLDLSTSLSDFNEYALMILVSQRTESLLIDASYDSRVLDKQEVESLLNHFMHVASQLGQSSSMDCRLDQLCLTTADDIERIWTWNTETISKGCHKRIHDMVEESVATHADEQAVCAWNGSLSYAQLDELSTRLANTLRASEVVVHGTLVAICIEKSMWSPVAMLGILKSGAAFVAVDVRNQPQRRVETIMREAGVNVVVSAGTAAQRFSETTGIKHVVDCDRLDDANFQLGPSLRSASRRGLDSDSELSHRASSPDDDEPATPRLWSTPYESDSASSFSCNADSLPSDTAFVVFTSGSTGVPKGIEISHQAFCTTVQHHGKALMLSPASRVYDFASYSFDIAVHNCLMALALGCCICVPSEDDRENDIEASFERLAANWVDLTPSVARILTPSSMPSLKTLVLSGEAVGKDLIEQWGKSVKLINAYGPAECQICTVNPNLQHPEEASKIGRGVACATWILDPEGDTLQPIGAVGELAIEGPIISSGYLNSANDSFMRDPSWLLAGAASCPGRTGTLYRTGDLARHLPDGTIEYAGRISAQVKVNGQRVELGEIEYHMRHYLPDYSDVVVDMVNSGGLELLYAFVVPWSIKSLSVLRTQSHSSSTPVDDLIAAPIDPPAKLNLLKDVLSASMIPGKLLEVSYIPLTATGKVDRRRLREAGCRRYTESQATASNIGPQTSDSQATDSLSRTMRAVWSDILRLDSSVIGRRSDFVQLGGDSISAMRLVKACRKAGLSLSVADIFRHSQFEELCRVVPAPQNGAASPLGGHSSLLTPAAKKLHAFELVADGDKDAIAIWAAEACGVQAHRVVDVYPCTPFQEAVFAATVSDASAYVQHMALRFGQKQSLHRLLAAWDSVLFSNPILRTRICQSETAALLQVVVRELQEWKFYATAEAYFSELATMPMGLGTPLIRLAVICAPSDVTILWTLHHALYDSWTTDLIMRQLSDCCLGLEVINDEPKYNQFVQYVAGQEGRNAKWWRSYLQGASDASRFPRAPPYEASSASSNSKIRKDLTMPELLPPGCTAAVLLRSAWAIVMARHSHCQKVCFGETRAGRNLPMMDLEQMRGPTTATVPILVEVQPEKTIGSLIREMRDKGTEMHFCEHLGLQKISRISADCKAACDFHTLIVVQDTKDDSFPAGYCFEVDDSNDDIRHFNSYHMTIVFSKRRGFLATEVVYKDGIISVELIDHLLQQVEVLLRSLCEAPAWTTISQLDVADCVDVDRIWQWNAQPVSPVSRTMHELVAIQSESRPDDLAIDAHDGQMTYRQLEDASSALAERLHLLGIGAGCFVPLCFEKSMWVPVAMLAVIKTGAAFCVLDMSHPEPRLRSISTILEARFVLSSVAQRGKAGKLATNVVVIDEGCTDQREVGTLPISSDGSNIMYVCFTSGSTGTPKGVMVTHHNLASAAIPQTQRFGFGPSQRVFDFSSHAFDAHIWHTWWSLVSGACLCIPSDQGRLNDLTGCMRSFGSTIAFLTPSVARTVNPVDIPTMTTLFLGGEAVTPYDVSHWKDHVELWGGYGPTEATPVSLFSRLSRPELASIIGNAIGVNTWICSLENHHKLASVGAIGELVLEGPLVGLGYYGDAEQTAAVFIEDPEFLVQRRRGRLYKTGDLARYSTDGTIQYMGRADSQVKLRGQRVEFGEIEFLLKSALPTASSIVCDLVDHQSGRQMLVAFIQSTPDQMLVDEQHVRSSLERQLPNFMIPEVFLAVETVPINASGKADRKQLKLLAPKLLQQRVEGSIDTSPERSRPLNPSETMLRGMWILCLDNRNISLGPESQFFDSGGDSIAAMKLSSLARRRHVSLSVKAIMDHPRLADMATCIASINEPIRALAPYSLVDPNDLDHVLASAQSACGIPVDFIEDVYPCTPVQVELFALTLKQPHAYVRRAVYEVPASIDLSRLRRAWDLVVARNAILRTRFVEVLGVGLLQVVVKGQEWAEAGDLTTYLRDSENQNLDLGMPLSWLALIHNESGSCLVWTAHHSVYDEWSVQVIEEQLRCAYRDPDQLASASAAPSFSSFVQYVVAQNAQAAREFWETRLAGSSEVVSTYPTASTETHRTQPSQTFRCDLQCVVAGGASVQATIHAAWSLIMSKMSGCDDVVFAATLAGRDAPIHGIENMTGPTIAPVPIRIQLGINRMRTVRELLEDVDRATIELAPYQHFGIRNIEAISEDACAACKLQTLLVVTPSKNGPTEATDDEGPGIATYGVEGQGVGSFHTFPLVLFFDPTDGRIALEVVFDPAVLAYREVEYLSSRLESVIVAFNERNRLVAEIDCLGKEDLHDIQHWTSNFHPANDVPLHRLILSAAEKFRDKIAIDAWDGVLSYESLEISSRRLGAALQERGVGRGSVVPILCNKSKHISVVALAVLRIGAAFLPVDSSLPEARLRAIVKQVNPTIVLATRLSERTSVLDIPMAYIEELSQSFGPKADEGAGGDFDTHISPDDLACVLFTSGSTGAPKGVMQTHRALSSAILYQSTATGFCEGIRSFEFAAYSFDVSWNMLFKTLAVGGTLCVPNDQDRLNDLVGALTRSRATLIELTPTVARLLPGPGHFPCLQTLILSGEPVDICDFAHWRPAVQVLVCYGPSECTSVSTVNLGVDSAGIGRAVGCATWLVHPEDHRRLVPVGAVGEILIEGPIVGKGYYGNNHVLTESSHVFDLPELSTSAQRRQDSFSRRRVGFKSGDLARHDSSGNLLFVGRKDSQAKLHGQRIELGEVQHHVRSILPGDLVASVVACVLQGGVDSSDKQRLAVFLSCKPAVAMTAACELIDPPEKMAFALETMDAHLGMLLPRYMVPADYYILNRFPHTANGKVDRKKLIVVVAGARPEQVHHGRPVSETQAVIPFDALTPAEQKLQDWWGVILDRPPPSISAEDNFFDLRGDSISAMKLVALARSGGVNLRVTDVFTNAKLSSLAKIVELRTSSTTDGDEASTTIAPFSLLGNSVNVPVIQAEIAALCGVTNPQLIEDAYPCTPLQESMLAASVRHPGAFVSMRLYRVPAAVDLNRLQEAWSTTIQRNSILRTRLVDLKVYGLTQIVLQEQQPWTVYSDMQSFLAVAESLAASMCHAANLMRFALIREVHQVRLVWLIHHAIYDGWMLPLIDEDLSQSYLGRPLALRNPDIRPLIKHLRHDEKEASLAFWSQELLHKGDDITVFPSLPSHDYVPCPNRYIEKTITASIPTSSSTSFSAFLYSTWSLLVSRLTGGNCVNFGAILTGRSAPIDGIDRMVAPTITTVPVAVEVDWSLTSSDFMSRIQARTVAMMPHEHVGVQSIRRAHGVNETACQFQTVLVIQPQSRTTRSSEQVGQPTKLVLMEELDETCIVGYPDQHGVLNQYGLMMELVPDDTGCITVRASFDAELISEVLMHRIINQWEHVMQRLAQPSAGEVQLAALDLTCRQDLADIWTWNQDLPEAIDDILVHEMVSRVTLLQPDALALDGWDGSLTYAELDSFSSRLARRLVMQGIGPTSFVPLLFQKSMWANVSMLAVLKTGGAFVPLDADHPEGRLRSVMQPLNAALILCSAQTRDRAVRLAPNALLVDSTSLQAELAGQSCGHDVIGSSVAQVQETLRPSNIAYAVFTSGSTGKAKGVKISHTNLVTAIQHQAGAGGYELNSTSRSLDSSSYAFDACVCNFFYTLARGGCLCVPSDHSLKGDIAAFMSEYKVNWAQLVASVARVIQAEGLPDLKSLVLTGESMTRGDVDKWGGRVRLLNAYGPTECTILCSISSPLRPDLAYHFGDMGHGNGANLWLGQVGNPNQLAPVGAVGEILIEGPIIGLGYLGPYEYPLVVDPPWLLKGTGTRSGRRGTLFRTGDQARYAPDGSLVFVGRIGSEIKLRGQKIDLIGIEDFVRRNITSELEVVADIVYLSRDGSNGQQVLLLFVSFSSTVQENTVASLEHTLCKLVPSLKQALDHSLPAYSRPEAFAPLSHLPRLSSRKIDRRRLKDLGQTLRPTELTWINGSLKRKLGRISPPSTPGERGLATLWADVLGISPESISREDDFFHLGGDSLSVMRLMTAAHTHGLPLQAKDVFSHSRLKTLAERLVLIADMKMRSTDEYRPCQLLQTPVPGIGSFIEEYVVPGLGVTVDQVEDVLPANGFQIDYIHNKEEPLGLQYAFLDIGTKTCWQSLVVACRAVVQSFQCLRARFLCHDKRYYQIILREAPMLADEIVSHEQMTTFSNRFCASDCRTVGLTDTMTKITLVELPKEGRRRVILRLSHMQNDGWCTIRILEALQHAYNGDPVPKTPDWTSLLHHRQRHAQLSRQYWRASLKDSSTVTPLLIFKARKALPDEETPSKVRTLRTHALPYFHRSQDNRRTRPTVIVNLAWALVLQHLLAQDHYSPGSASDVVFGNVTTGRNGGGLPGLEAVVGPCVNMLPTRFLLPHAALAGVSRTSARTQLLRDLVEVSVQQLDDRSMFEGLDWDDMVDSCTNWPAGTRYTSAVHFRNMSFEPELSFRVKADDGKQPARVESLSVIWYELVAKPHWTTILCYPEDDVLRLWLLADPDQISDEGADEILGLLAGFVDEILEALQM